MSTKVLIQTIQFSLSTQFISICPIDRVLSDATTPGQSGPGSNGNEGVLCILKSFSNIGAWQSNCLVSYTEHSLVEGLTPTTPANWATPEVVVSIRVTSKGQTELCNILLGIIIYIKLNYLCWIVVIGAS